jgi:hypothetical protein
VSEAFDQLAEAWREAAVDLGIDVEVLADAVHVKEFGRPAGMPCALRDSRDGQVELQRKAEGRGMGWSVLSGSYLKYDRDEWVDMLNDWGWFAEGDAPDWYTGEPWTE